MKIALYPAILIICVACSHNAVRVSQITTYDGDTFKANIEGWPEVVGKNIPIRLRGIDTPEIRGKCPEERQQAIKARDYLDNALRSADSVELTNIERGKYFRLIADVMVDGKPVATEMIELGLGRLYRGGKRGGWCEE